MKPAIRLRGCSVGGATARIFNWCGAPSLEAIAFVFVEPVPNFDSERCGALNLSPGPHAQFENPLEFFGRIVPPVVITEAMSRKVVFERMATAAAVGQNVIGLPL
jgi:hypothetical protein